MTSDELKMINEEVHDNSTPAKKPQETFAYRWLRRAHQVVMFWSWMAAVSVLLQFVLLFFVDSERIVPAVGSVVLAAGIIAGALIGGEKIAEGLKNGSVMGQK